jgi:hypothetical protein
MDDSQRSPMTGDAQAMTRHGRDDALPKKDGTSTPELSFL